MPFNLLLLTSLKRETKFAETGNTVSITPRDDEQVLFFELDQESCALRRVLLDQMPEKNICDGLILYVCGDKRILCLVELKGSDVAHAAKQISNTYNFLHPFFSKSLKKTSIGRSLLDTIEWRAYVLQHIKSSAPKKKSKRSNTKKEEEGWYQLSELFSKYKISKDRDIGPFLRS